MNKSKTSIITILIFLFLIGLSVVCVSPTFSTESNGKLPFSDVPADHEAREALEYLYDNEWIIGYPDGTFNGEGFISRYDLAVMLSRFWSRLDDEFTGKGLDIKISGFVQPYKFQDVPVDHWSYAWGLELLADQNLLSWNDVNKNFNGDSYATRIDLAIYFGRMLDRIEDAYSNAGFEIDDSSAAASIIYSDVVEDDYAYQEIFKVVNRGIMPGYSDNQWQGERVFNRYEFAQILAGFLRSALGQLEHVTQQSPGINIAPYSDAGE